MVQQAERLYRDLIHAIRSLAKARAFTFVCVMTLGIGMAPIIAIQYGSGIFTTAPPRLDPNSPTPLVELVTTPVGRHKASADWSYPDFIDLRAASTGVALTGWAMGVRTVTLPESGEKTAAEALYVEANYFETMNVTLARGSAFGDPQSADPVVVLGYEFWQRRLKAPVDIIGTSLILNGTPHLVTGIGPEKFQGHLSLHGAELFLPLSAHPTLVDDRGAQFDRSKAFVRIHGRLAANASVAQASAAVGAVTARLAKEYSATNEFRAGIVEPYYAPGSLENGEIAVLLAVSQAMMAVPLLVVCLNVSGMFQVRNAMRERELSIRQAIGATRAALVRHMLAESIVLAGAGGALASIVLFNLPGILTWWLGEPMPPRLEAALTVDGRMIAVAAGLCLMTSLVFGWLPALRFSRPKIMTSLKDEGGTSGIRAGRIHRWTTALQVAIAVPLLVLSFTSLERVRATATAELGCACDLLYAAPLALDTGASTIADSAVRRVQAALRTTNGIASVTVADGLPLDFRYRLTRISPESDGATVVSAHVTRVGDEFLDTMGISLVRGRGFTADDGAGTPLVTVISRTLADRLFDDANPIGQRLSFGTAGEDVKQPKILTVVGVAGDFPTSQMSTDREQLLVPIAQHQDLRGDSVRIEDDRSGEAVLMVVVRAAPGESEARMTAALENAIRDVNPDFDRREIVTGAWLRRKSMDDFLNQFGVASIFGGVALVLGALGIYGVVGLMVTTRIREIAVRVTLGASRHRVIGMILFDVTKLVAPGVVVGAIITFALTRLEGGVTVSTIEPLAYVAGGAMAILVSLLASFGPARRAASVQPMVAMRST